MTAHCVTITPTIGDGTVIRWYASEEALIYGSCAISASRNAVVGHGGQLTPDLFQAAWDAHQRLRDGADVSDLETHRRTRIFGGDYERVNA